MAWVTWQVALPAALVRAGAEVIVMVPKYATIKDEYKAQMEHFSDFYVSLGSAQ